MFESRLKFHRSLFLKVQMNNILALVLMYLILYVVLIVIMSYFLMYFVSDDKNKGDQSINLIMAWRQTGDKPLSEPMMTQFNDAYMRRSASMS